jgi:hypothetical protein
VEHLGLKPRNGAREVRRIQNAIEQTTRVSSVSLCRTVAPPARSVGVRCARAHGIRAATTITMNEFRHGPGDDTGPDP